MLFFVNQKTKTKMGTKYKEQRIKNVHLTELYLSFAVHFFLIQNYNIPLCVFRSNILSSKMISISLMFVVVVFCIVFQIFLFQYF